MFMFLLVTVFQHAARRPSKERMAEMTAALKKFVERKKLLALGLTVLLLSLAAADVLSFAFEVFQQSIRGSLSSLPPPAAFYSEVLR